MEEETCDICGEYLTSYNATGAFTMSGTISGEIYLCKKCAEKVLYFLNIIGGDNESIM